MINQERLEDSVLQAIDVVAEQSKNRATKMLADLFKSTVLKKYKDAFDFELKQGKVHRKNIVKAVDFCYSDMCFTFRKILEISDDDKERLIIEAKQMKDFVKETVEQILDSKGIEIII